MQTKVLKGKKNRRMHVLLQEVLRKMPLCATRYLWQQGTLPLLQQLEDQEGWP
ncbi:Zinc finger C3H1 domain-containing protein [Bienertia sinuspersici]